MQAQLVALFAATSLLRHRLSASTTAETSEVMMIGAITCVKGRPKPPQHENKHVTPAEGRKMRRADEVKTPKCFPPALRLLAARSRGGRLID